MHIAGLHPRIPRRKMKAEIVTPTWEQTSGGVLFLLKERGACFLRRSIA
jgi:hypothetical protein